MRPPRAFGVGIPSVKRYVATYREGMSLAPKKQPGSKPKLERCEEADKRLRDAVATLADPTPSQEASLGGEARGCDHQYAIRCSGGPRSG